MLTAIEYVLSRRLAGRRGGEIALADGRVHALECRRQCPKPGASSGPRTRPRRLRMGTGPVLPDVLGPGLRIVFCGMAAGDRSAREGAYYADPGN